MGLERILLAAGAHDADRTDRLARVATDIAAPADATVILGHAFTEDRFEEMSADLHPYRRRRYRRSDRRQPSLVGSGAPASL